jgi:hypothetical protein
MVLRTAIRLRSILFIIDRATDCLGPDKDIGLRIAASQPQKIRKPIPKDHSSDQVPILRLLSCGASSCRIVTLWLVKTTDGLEKRKRTQFLSTDSPRKYATVRLPSWKPRSLNGI